MTSLDSAPRGAHLAEARRRDSDTKTERAVAAVARLHAAGERVTFTRVAREARVSTWFVYNKSEVDGAVRHAIEDQSSRGTSIARTPTNERVSLPSLHTDLALARQEIKDLKQDRDRLRKRLQLSIGAEPDATSREELLQRIQELDRTNHDLRSSEESLRAEACLANDRIKNLESDLAAARLGLRRMVKDLALRSVTSASGQ